MEEFWIIIGMYRIRYDIFMGSNGKCKKDQIYNFIEKNRSKDKKHNSSEQENCMILKLGIEYTKLI